MSRLARLWILVMTAGFLLAAGLRLSPFFLLNPDCGEYVVRARSLATLRGYRDVARPDQMARSLRPPGVSLLLVPAAWIAPYGVIPAKITIGLLSLVLIYLYGRFSQRVAGPRATLSALALLLASPFFLLYASEIVSEVPYTANLLAAVCLLEATAPSARWRWLAAGLLAGLAPLVRTVGWALVLPTVLVLVLGPERRWRLAAAVLTVLPGGFWVLRDRWTGEPLSYQWLAEKTQWLLGVSSPLK